MVPFVSRMNGLFTGTTLHRRSFDGTVIDSYESMRIAGVFRDIGLTLSFLFRSPFCPFSSFLWTDNLSMDLNIVISER